jgi:hypothetical protein
LPPAACRAAAACASALRASDVTPAMAPKFIESIALLGTMMVLPRSLTLSYSMFMPRRCNATG